MRRRPLSRFRAVAAALAVTTGVAASCRSLPMRGATAVPRPDSSAVVQAATLAVVPPPVIRVGILTDVGRASIGADWGVIVKGVAADGSAVNLTVQRATFVPLTPGKPGPLKLLETGQAIASAALFPANSAQDLSVDGVAYRGLLEARATDDGALTVINVVNLEDYLRGVVPNELSPVSFPHGARRREWTAGVCGALAAADSRPSVQPRHKPPLPLAVHRVDAAELGDQHGPRPDPFPCRLARLWSAAGQRRASTSTA